MKTLKERLGQCELCAIAPRAKVSEEETSARLRADGFIIDGLTYVKRNRLERWFPKKSVRAVLRQAGVFHAKRNDTPTVEKTIPGIKGKPRYYRINANALGGSSK
jgi:hypothetical protein